MMILHGSAAQVKGVSHPVSYVKKAVDGELEVDDALKKCSFHVVWRAWRKGPPIGREVMHDIEGFALSRRTSEPTELKRSGLSSSGDEARSPAQSRY